MINPIFRRFAPCVVLALALVSTTSVAQDKRPLRHTDYDSWRSIQSQKLSPDGNFLAYGLFPQEGDGEVVIRNLKTGVESRAPAGARPEPPRPNPLLGLIEEEPPTPPAITVQFTPDSRFVVFSTFAPKAEVDKAKKEKRKPEEMPKGGMVVADLSSGALTRVQHIKNFQVPEKSGTVVAYLHQPEKPDATSAKEVKGEGQQGHSWGGYQIAYMVTQTNRFRAASAGAPVANMISAYDGIRWGPGIPRQFQYEHSQSRIGGTLWQAPLRYIENSPIFMADRVSTPLLMIHNDSDDAVPWYQGIEYFLALRRLGKEAYMFSYNGEPHGLWRRANQKDYSVRLQQFFDHYLKGAPKPEWMEKGILYLERDEEKERLKSKIGVY